MEGLMCYGPGRSRRPARDWRLLLKGWPGWLTVTTKIGLRPRGLGKSVGLTIEAVNRKFSINSLTRPCGRSAFRGYLGMCHDAQPSAQRRRGPKRRQ
jgi:hypothetical protein